MCLHFAFQLVRTQNEQFGDWISNWQPDSLMRRHVSPRCVCVCVFVLGSILPCFSLLPFFKEKLPSWRYLMHLMTIIFAQMFLGVCRAFFFLPPCVFLYYKGASRGNSSNSDKQIDNQEDKWLLLCSTALVLIFIFFPIQSIENTV